MKKIINIISTICLSVLLFSCSDIMSGTSENKLDNGNKSLTVNMFMPDYSELAGNNARAVSPNTAKIRIFTLIANTGKWTYQSANDLELSDERVVKTKVSDSIDDDFVPGYVYSFTFENVLSEGIWEKGTVRIALLDSTNKILSEGFNADAIDLTSSESATAAFYTEPYSVQNSNNVFKNSSTAVSIAAGKMDFWYGYFVKDVTYTITLSPTGSSWLDIAIFDEKGCYKEYKSVTNTDDSKVTITPENDCGMYFGIYNKNQTSVSYKVETTFDGEIETDPEANYDNLFSDPTKWTIIDQSKYCRPEIEDNKRLYIPMGVDSNYKTISYTFTVNKEMELVYDENTFVCPIYAGEMWVGVDGKGYTPSPNQIIEYITKRIHIYPGKHTFMITGTEQSNGQNHRHIVENMQLLEIKKNDSLDEKWSSGKIDKTFWSFRGRVMPEIVSSIVDESYLAKHDEEKQPKVLFAENETYGKFVKLTALEISSAVQTNQNGSCSLILYNFVPPADGKIEFDYFEDLGVKDIVTLKVNTISSNNTESNVFATQFKNSYNPEKKEGYGITLYMFDDKPRSWNKYEITNLVAGQHYNIYWEIPKVSSTLDPQTEIENCLSKAFYIDNVKFVPED